MFIASAIVTLVFLYAVVGVVFAVPFVIRGAAMIDGGAEKSSLGFKLIILPASAALWPLLLVRWVRAFRQPKGRA